MDLDLNQIFKLHSIAPKVRQIADTQNDTAENGEVLPRLATAGGGGWRMVAASCRWRQRVGGLWRRVADGGGEWRMAAARAKKTTTLSHSGIGTHIPDTRQRHG